MSALKIIDCAEALAQLGLKNAAVEILSHLIEDNQENNALLLHCAKSLGQLNHENEARKILIKLYKKEEQEATLEALWDLTAV